MNKLPYEIQYTIMSYLDLVSIKKLASILLITLPKKNDEFWKKNYKNRVTCTVLEIFPLSYFKKVSNFDLYATDCQIFQFSIPEDLSFDTASTRQQQQMLHWLEERGPFFTIFIKWESHNKMVAVNVMLFETLCSLMLRLWKHYPQFFDLDNNDYILYEYYHTIFSTNVFDKSLYSLSLVNGKTYNIIQIPFRQNQMHYPNQKAKILDLACEFV